MKTALIGYGYWGKILCKYIDISTKFTLIKIFDKFFQKENKRFTNQIQDILKDEIKVVFIASSLETHYQLAKLCLENNKHVFCEKPLVLNNNKLNHLMNLANKKNRCLFTDYTWLASKSIKKIKATIPGFTNIYYVNMAIKQFGKFYQKDNVYEVIGSHLLSILFYLFPKIKFRFEFDEYDNHKGQLNAGVIRIYSNSIKGKICTSLYNPCKERLIYIRSDKEILCFNPLADYSLQVYKYNCTNSYLKTKEKYSFDESNNIKYTLDDFYNDINKQNNHNLVISKKVTEVLAQYRSSKTNES